MRTCIVVLVLLALALAAGSRSRSTRASNAGLAVGHVGLQLRARGAIAGGRALGRGDIPDVHGPCAKHRHRRDR